MSGSSMDGIDVAFCTFSQDANQQWSGHLVECETFDFQSNLKQSLLELPQSSGLQMARADSEFARFSAQCVAEIVQRVGRKPLAIASHGHTIFHSPTHSYTVQIGNGGLLAGFSGLPVVSDFRTTDVGLGGQGAPLVPGAERFLFSEYDACLNLGGIANVSFLKSPPFLGFDISPCNQILNEVAGWIGISYDEDGNIARSGSTIPSLLNQLNSVGFYSRKPPKSLGNEEVSAIWKPILTPWKSEPENLLRTLSTHIAQQIARSVLSHKPEGKMLATGGGALNGFLMECLRREMGVGWIVEIPDARLVSFKEAYCFAFLGLKRWLGEVNCFCEVTGARRDSCAGAIYLP